MKKNYFLVSCLVLLSCGSPAEMRPYVYLLTDSRNIPVEVEVVDTPEETAQGLMFREKLEENSGMLFVFETEQPLSFWMKNTLIPLDMMFIDSAKKIVHIQKNAQPCQAEPCPLYFSSRPAKYVLEVNGGWSEKNGVEAGDTLETHVP